MHPVLLALAARNLHNATISVHCRDNISRTECTRLHVRGRCALDGERGHQCRLCDAYYVQPSFVDVGEVLARRDARGLGARETATEADEHRDRGLFAPNRHRTLHCGS